MPARVLIQSGSVRISRPGVDIYNFGRASNLLLDISRQATQVLEHGIVSIPSNGKVQGYFGPYEQIPDMVYRLAFDDGRTRDPPAYWDNPSLTYFFYDIGNMKVTTGGFTMDVAGIPGGYIGGTLPKPTAVVYQILRRRSGY